MIFVDASAIVAIIAREPDAPSLAERLKTTTEAATSPIAVYESALALARIASTEPIKMLPIVNAFLQNAAVQSVSISETEIALALEAFERFGKGRHPAKLNMGDCFAYACARANRARLLFKGDDFPQTDIEIA